MLTSSQTTAIVIALVVFFGLTIPGLVRYVLLGGTAILLVAAILLGDGPAFLADLPR